MTEKARPPEDTTADAHDDAEPALGGEVHPAPLGPDDLLPLERYGPGDLLPSIAQRRTEDTEAGGSGPLAPERGGDAE